MTARDKFVVNQRVAATARYCETFPRPKHRSTRSRDYDQGLLGVVAGFGLEPQLVRVQRDGRATIETFHMDFWEPK